MDKAARIGWLAPPPPPTPWQSDCQPRLVRLGGKLCAHPVCVAGLPLRARPNQVREASIGCWAVEAVIEGHTHPPHPPARHKSQRVAGFWPFLGCEHPSLACCWPLSLFGTGARSSTGCGAGGPFSSLRALLGKRANAAAPAACGVCDDHSARVSGFFCVIPVSYVTLPPDLQGIASSLAGGGRRWGPPPAPRHPPRNGQPRQGVWPL